jgi:hypothetical protein
MDEEEREGGAQDDASAAAEPESSRTPQQQAKAPAAGAGAGEARSDLMKTFAESGLEQKARDLGLIADGETPTLHDYPKGVRSHYWCYLRHCCYLRGAPPVLTDPPRLSTCV